MRHFLKFKKKKNGEKKKKDVDDLPNRLNHPGGGMSRDLMQVGLGITDLGPEELRARGN